MDKIKVTFASGVSVRATLLRDKEPELAESLWQKLETKQKGITHVTVSTGDSFSLFFRPLVERAHSVRLLVIAAFSTRNLRRAIFCGTILKCTFAMVRARNLGLWEHRLHRLTLRIWIHLRANAKRSATTLISIISWRL